MLGPLSGKTDKHTPDVFWNSSGDFGERRRSSYLQRIEFTSTPSPQLIIIIANMVVRIRLARFGNKHQPFYNIVVAQARSARNSKPIEVIGTLNPIPQRPTNLSDEEARNARPYKEISLDRSRAKYWLGVGAQPSDTVWRLLSLAGLVKPKYEPPKAQ
ncbi:ribosomal protein S16 domain-containing protein [Aspergillus recurvatus]